MLPPGRLNVGSRLGGRGLWIYLNANVLGRPQGQQEQWWEGAEALGLEAPLEICSAASGSSAKHFPGLAALGADSGPARGPASKLSLGCRAALQVVRSCSVLQGEPGYVG